MISKVKLRFEVNSGLLLKGNCVSLCHFKGVNYTLETRIMLPTLQKRFSALENVRVQLLKQLEPLNESQLAFKSAPETWSILDVVEHLILVERASLSYLHKKRSDLASLKKLGRVAPVWRCFLLACALRSPLKFKAPVKSVIPNSGQSLRELQTVWDDLRQQWRTTLESITPDMMRLPLSGHPVAGRFTAAQGLFWMAEHLRHHLKQIVRIQKASRQPL